MMKKHIFSIILVLVLCFWGFTITISAANSDFVVEDIYTDGNLYTNVLTAYHGAGGNVVIPEGIQYIGLGLGWDGTGVGSGVFAGRTDITGVTLPSSTYAIGGTAFSGCTGLTNVNLPYGLKYITLGAFQGCTGLTDMTIPGSVKKIYTGAFKGCTNLKRVTLCEGIQEISGTAFQDCFSLKSIAIPSGVTVGWAAFKNCTNLTDVHISPNATITDDAFEGTPWQEQQQQGDWLIINGTLLKYSGNDLDIIIPNTVTTLGAYWYQGNWDEIRSITIPDSVTKLGVNSFNGAFSVPPWGTLSTIKLPNSVTEIEGGAFAYSDLTTLVLPDSLTTIGNGAFSKCQYLTDIVIPNSVSSIGNWVFDNSQNVTIHGSAGSYAESYAKENGIPFVADVFSTVGGFNDVRANHFYAKPVLWAVEKRITSGTSATTFSPDSTCTTAQILTFLWRANGCPQPISQTNEFTDVKEEDYFWKAASWAKEAGLISGSEFNGNTPCTRAATMMYMWKLAGSPTTYATSAFEDVPDIADYAQAVSWAVNEGITSGTSNTTFSPQDTCTRAQIVTFLWHNYG